MSNLDKAIKYIEQNDIESLKQLIEKDPTILNQKDKTTENTLLHHAIFQDHKYNVLDLIEYLIQKGANVNNLNCFDHTPLYSAVSRNNKEIIKLLLNYGADPNIKTKSGDTCLHDVVIVFKFINSTEIIKIANLLIQHNADVNAVNTTLQTPLHYAVIQNVIDFAKFLILHGADLYLKDKSNKTVLDYVEDKRIKNELLFVYNNRDRILESRKVVNEQ